MVKNLEQVDIRAIKSVFDKLEKCRNQENNPDSSAYKRKIQDLLNEDEADERVSKMPRTTYSPRMPGVAALR